MGHLAVSMSSGTLEDRAWRCKVGVSPLIVCISVVIEEHELAGLGPGRSGTNVVAWRVSAVCRWHWQSRRHAGWTLSMVAVSLLPLLLPHAFPAHNTSHFRALSNIISGSSDIP